MAATISAYPWQLPNVDKLTDILRTQPFAIDASATGVGKTVIALTVVKNLGCKALIICPCAVKTSWLRTAAAMDCSDQILDVTNPERLQYKNPFVTGLQWQLPKGTLVVWDEFHRGCSGKDSQTTKIAAATKPQGIKMLAMSATIATSPLSMRALGYLANLHKFRPGDFFNWCRSKGCYKADFANGALVFPKGPKGQSIMADINKELEPIMVCLHLEDVPAFPETRIIAGLYDIESKYLKEIAQATEEMREELKKPSNNPLTIRLRARERTELCKVALLTDLVKEALAANKSVVVFINFRSTLAALREQFPESGFICGDQDPVQRQGFVDAFQSDKIQILLCTLQSGGVGISLHGLPGMRERASFLTYSDSASDCQQALGRVRRSGGGPSVQTIVLVAGTVEEKIYQNVQNKLNNLKALTDSDFAV